MTSKVEREAAFEELTHDDRESMQLMRSLLNNEGWKSFVRLLESDLKTRRDLYELGDVEGMDGLIQREFLRGEIAMLRTMLGMPEALMESSNTALHMRTEQYKNEEERHND
jgi:hypothetical protein